MMLARRLGAEALGTMLLLATVVGSGIMGERLAGGHDAIVLLGNSLATGCTLVVLIATLGPVSGAHFNPAVTAVMALRGELSPRVALAYAAVQVPSALAGVALAHLMFAEPLFTAGDTVRSGGDQWLAEATATFGLLFTIIAGSRHCRAWVPALVGLYITAAYWFTASTSFANPAVTLARAATDTFAGIRPQDVPAFLAVQCAGALFAWGTCAALLGDDDRALGGRATDRVPSATPSARRGDG
jgi:glycerol uptake facilitator-like aquaporin